MNIRPAAIRLPISRHWQPTSARRDISYCRRLIVAFRRYPVMVGLLVFGCADVNAADFQIESCEQIRGQISAQVGPLPKPDTDLLKKLSGRSECNFSAPEVYRAAYGDMPMPKEESRRYRSKRHHHHDDD